jgi:molybdopterin converting factor small subunit
MSLTVSLPSVLSRLADGNRSLAASGTTVGEAVADVTRRFPSLATRLVDDGGQPYPFVTYYLNDEDIRFTGGFAALVSDGDELTIVSAVAGG